MNYDSPDHGYPTMEEENSVEGERYNGESNRRSSDSSRSEKAYSRRNRRGRRSRSSSSSRSSYRRRERRSRSRSRSRNRSYSRTSSSTSSRRRSGRRRSSRSSSRHRSRDRYRSEYSHSPRSYDDDYDSRTYRDRKNGEELPPNNTLVVKGLPLDCDENMMWDLIGGQGFQPKDIRVVKRRDTGQGRGFGFVEFLDVEEASRWMEYSQGRLKIDDRHWADVEYSMNKAVAGPANAFTNILAQRGDWICAKCGTNNFKKRDICFKCNMKRDESEAAMTGEGFAEIGLLPCDTLLLRNLSTETDEDKILSSLQKTTTLSILRVLLARNAETNTSKGFAYIQLSNVADAAQLLITLTAISKLNIDGREVLVAYSKYPLTAVLTGANLSQMVSSNSAAAQLALSGQIPSVSGTPLSSSDVTNAAAAVAQNAIKKAHVMRQVTAQNVQAAQLASFRAATIFLPSTALLLQHQQILAAQALQEMAAAQILQERVQRQTAALTNLGTVKTPYGELPRYPNPDVQTFQFDPSTGFYFDATTGLHYDAKSQYFYNSETRQYLYWDATHQTYLPAPAGESSNDKPDKSEKEPTIAPAVSNEKQVQGEETAKEPKEKKEKVNVAKKIQKDMEKWAKQQNQRKETSGKNVAVSSTSSASEAAASTWTTETKSATADAAFSILERTGGAPGLKGSLVSYDANDSDEEQRNTPVQQAQRPDEDLEFTDWTKMACLLCRRQFPSKDVLIKHQQLSDLHQQNLMARRKQRSMEEESSTSGFQYRDRAKERRAKFGDADEDRPKPGTSKALYEPSVTGASSAPSFSSSSKNIGSKLMKSMGWREGEGLGKSHQGIVDPITSQRRVQGAGIGTSGAILTSGPSASYKEHVKAALRQKFNDM